MRNAWAGGLVAWSKRTSSELEIIRPVLATIAHPSWFRRSHDMNGRSGWRGSTNRRVLRRIRKRRRGRNKIMGKISWSIYRSTAVFCAGSGGSGRFPSSSSKDETTVPRPGRSLTFDFQHLRHSSHSPLSTEDRSEDTSGMIGRTPLVISR